MALDKYMTSYFRATDVFEIQYDFEAVIEDCRPSDLRVIKVHNRDPESFHAFLLLNLLRLNFDPCTSQLQYIFT